MMKNVFDTDPKKLFVYYRGIFIEIEDWQTSEGGRTVAPLCSSIMFKVDAVFMSNGDVIKMREGHTAIRKFITGGCTPHAKVSSRKDLYAKIAEYRSITNAFSKYLEQVEQSPS